MLHAPVAVGRRRSAPRQPSPCSLLLAVFDCRFSKVSASWTQNGFTRNISSPAFDNVFSQTGCTGLQVRAIALLSGLPNDICHLPRPPALLTLPPLPALPGTLARRS